MALGNLTLSMPFSGSLAVRVCFFVLRKFARNLNKKGKINENKAEIFEYLDGGLHGAHARAGAGFCGGKCCI